MTRRALLALAACAACGDNVPDAEPFAAVSGSRLALYWYGYNDGTRQPEPSEFYDKVQHARCTAQWWDDAVRCLPQADEAGYRDSQCSVAIGRALTIGAPTHFIEYEPFTTRPLRIFVAGERTMLETRYYRRQEDQCIGPFTDPPDTPYFTVTAALTAADFMELHEREVGDGRLGVRLITSDDGMRVPAGFFDRLLATGCAPGAARDGGAICEPTEAPPASYFRDPGCREAVVTRSASAPVPAIARVVEPSGCYGYRAVGDEVTSGLYRLEGEACVPAPLFPAPRAFLAAEPVEPMVLERTHEVIPGRRLQRVVLGDGELRVFDERLYDTATRADCRSQQLGNGDVRCVPAATAPALQLYTSAACTIAAATAEVPVRSCVRPAFAVSSATGVLAVHAIGDPMAAPLFYLDGTLCQPYTVTTGHVLHQLGPPIDPTAFAGALYYGER